MLTLADAKPTIGVKNLEVSCEFYEKKLGLSPIDKRNGLVQHYQCGNSLIELYKTDFAGTNKATTVTWGVGDNLEKEVSDLKSKGIVFEHYNMPQAKLVGDIHVMQGMKAAWFKDPDGNILCLHDH